MDERNAQPGPGGEKCQVSPVRFLGLGDQADGQDSTSVNLKHSGICAVAFNPNSATFYL